uniref:Uncharacterized protein n=1 Tax=Timema monikensis TaxID=170555 RepID=A0A7R9HUW9_9NEOP|nr:unnamed protein product [Timema monikensis]
MSKRAEVLNNVIRGIPLMVLLLSRMLCNGPSQEEVPELNTRALVTASMVQRLFSGCTHIVRASPNLDFHAINFQKHMSSLSVPSSVISLNAVTSLSCNVNRAFYVLPCVDNSTSELLKQASSLNVLGGRTWLVFQDVFEAFSSDLDVPFNSEIILGSSDKQRHTTLQQVK